MSKKTLFGKRRAQADAGGPKHPCRALFGSIFIGSKATFCALPSISVFKLLSGPVFTRLLDLSQRKIPRSEAKKGERRRYAAAGLKPNLEL
jgi:hypothetical protein